MQSRRSAIILAVIVSVVLGSTASASAQYGDFQRMLFRGLEYAGNNTFLSQPQGGPLYNYNQFSQRLEYNRAGDGYTYESFHFFGPDSYGNANTLDLGPFKIQLGLDPTVAPSGQPIGLHSRVGYTTRFIPEVFFEAQTGQRSYNQFSGISTFAPTPLNYTVTINTGIQDFEWTGNALVDANGRMNALGFYDFQLRFTNIGSQESDGVFVHDEQVTDFDLGPIDVSGSVALDMVASFMQAIGATNEAAAPRILSGSAQKQNEVDELFTRLELGETLSDDEMQFLVQQMFEAAFRADPMGVLTNGLPAKVPGFEALTLEFTPVEGEGGTASATIPEPGTLALLATVFGTLGLARPLRRRFA